MATKISELPEADYNSLQTLDLLGEDQSKAVGGLNFRVNSAALVQEASQQAIAAVIAAGGAGGGGGGGGYQPNEQSIILDSGGKLAVNFGNALGTAAAGNDPRIVGAEQTARKNVASGYAGLDTSGRLLVGQIPPSVFYTLSAAGTLALGGVFAAGAANPHQWVSYVDATGHQHFAQPAFSDVSGTLTIAQIPIGTGANTVASGPALATETSRATTAESSISTTANLALTNAAAAVSTAGSASANASLALANVPDGSSIAFQAGSSGPFSVVTTALSALGTASITGTETLQVLGSVSGTPTALQTTAAALYSGSGGAVEASARAAADVALSNSISANTSSITANTGSISVLATGLTAETLARQNQNITTGTVTAGGSLVLGEAGGASINVIGTIVGPPGATGPQGAPGANAVSPMGTATAAWNPVSNTPSIATGGAGEPAGTLLTIGGPSNGATTTLGTAIDGITSVVQGDQLYQSGTAWTYLQRIANGNYGVMTAGQTVYRDNSDGVWRHRWADPAGNYWMQLDTTLGLQVGLINSTSGTFTNLTVTNYTGPAPSVAAAGGNTLLATNATTGQSIIGGVTTEQGRPGFVDFMLPGRGYGISLNLVSGAVEAPGGFTVQGTPIGGAANVIATAGDTLLATNPTLGESVLAGHITEQGRPGFVDFMLPGRAYGVSVNLITGAVEAPGGFTVQGVPVGTGGGSGGTTFSAQDIANIDAIGLASSAKVRTRANTTAQAPTTQFIVQMTVGESRRVGTNGAPPVSVTQLTDSLMYGQATRGVPGMTPGTFTVVGDSNFHPLIAVAQTNGSALPVPTRTGALSNVGTVSVAAGSTNGTISWPTQSGIDATTIFAAGDGFQMQGWVTATGNNYSTSTTNTLTVQSVTPSAIVTVEKPTNSNNGNQPQITSAAESGITFAQANYALFAEDTSIAQANEWRQQYLNVRGLTSDPTRIPVVTCPGIAHPIAQQSPLNPAFGQVPNNLYFSRYTGALTGIQSTATATGYTIGGTTYKGSASCISIEGLGGGDEAGYNIPKAAFRGIYDFWLKSLVAACQSAFGQTREPFQYSAVVSGQQLNDGNVQQSWAVSTSYTQFGACVIANGNIYVCTVSGTSAASGSGPSGTGSAITDGSATWCYLQAAPAQAEACPLPMAQMELFGCSPPTGFPYGYAGQNYNRYLWGPEYFSPDRGPHGTNYGYVMSACQIAKVRTKVELLRQGWLPCHVLGVYVRGAQILVSMHVPEPPLQVATPFSYDVPQVFADLGFSAADSGGALTITSAVTAGQTCVMLTCSRAVNVASLVLRYADSANHNGNGSICDSDPWQPALSSYQYALGSGQLLGDNFSTATGTGFVLQNGKPFALYNWLCPGAWPGVAY